VQAAHLPRDVWVGADQGIASSSIVRQRRGLSFVSIFRSRLVTFTIGFQRLDSRFGEDQNKQGETTPNYSASRRLVGKLCNEWNTSGASNVPVALILSGRRMQPTGM
jgi:hypothetical protein